MKIVKEPKENQNIYNNEKDFIIQREGYLKQPQLKLDQK